MACAAESGTEAGAVKRAQLAESASRPAAPPPAGFWDITAVTQTTEGPWRRLRGKAELVSAEMSFAAEEIDYNEDTGYVEARGSVRFLDSATRQQLEAERVEYDLKEETGKFYKVRGWGPPAGPPRPGVLASQNPYYFEGAWAERLQDRYLLHDGFVTNCRVPNPWWKLRGPTFDIVPGRRAIAYGSLFQVRKIPVFYAPFFYKSLERAPRKSGFLTPNIGNSSRRGKMLGVGYYWAINRSYDLAYRAQYFTQRGLAHHLDFRGQPRRGTDYDIIIYGVQDRGQKLASGARVKQGGFSAYGSGSSDLGRGFQARGQVNYLSSLPFRLAFTESFNEAIFSEVHSIGFVKKNWSYYTFNSVFARLENFQSLEPGDSVVIRKLPEFEFKARDRRWVHLPVWVSLESTAGLIRRNQPLFQTRQFLERMDLRPRVMTALRWKEFHLLPSFSIRETHYGERQELGRVTGRNINRHAREFEVALRMPPLARVYNGRAGLGEKLKHVIEPRASFRHVAGVADFDRLIRFDETELYSNTTEAEVSLTNRIFAKKQGVVSEVFTWELWQRRYFDPDFGGAVAAGRRNVVRSAVDLTPYAFLDRPRHYSPVASVMRVAPRPGFGVEWRSDYDPLRGGIVNSGFTADVRLGQYLLSAGHNQVRSHPLLTPSANQFRGLIGYGQPSQKGWNAAFTAIYDYKLGQMQFATTQVGYNTDCCGLSLQYRRFSFGFRNENQFRVAFAVANIGSFGTLKKQERLF